MRFNSHVRRTCIILVSVAALPACVQPLVQQQADGDAVTIEREPGLTNQLNSLQRYASQMEQTYAAQEAEIRSLQRYAAQMEEIYAAQEAEILSLQKQVAALTQ